MENIPSSVIVTVVASVLGVLGFVFGRLGSAKSDGERWGRVDGKIEAHGNELNAIKQSMAKQEMAMEKGFANVTHLIEGVQQRLETHSKEDAASIREVEREIKEEVADFRESLKRLHARLDSHISEAHVRP